MEPAGKNRRVCRFAKCFWAPEKRGKCVPHILVGKFLRETLQGFPPFQNLELFLFREKKTCSSGYNIGGKEKPPESFCVGPGLRFLCPLVLRKSQNRGGPLARNWFFGAPILWAQKFGGGSQSVCHRPREIGEIRFLKKGSWRSQRGEIFFQRKPCVLLVV